MKSQKTTLAALALLFAVAAGPAFASFHNSPAHPDSMIGQVGHWINHNPGKTAALLSVAAGGLFVAGVRAKP